MTNQKSSAIKKLRNIRVTAVHQIEPKYWFRPSVIEAVRREVLKDLRKSSAKRLRVPSGVEATWSEPNWWDRLKESLKGGRGGETGS